MNPQKRKSTWCHISFAFYHMDWVGGEDFQYLVRVCLVCSHTEQRCSLGLPAKMSIPSAHKEPKLTSGSPCLYELKLRLGLQNVFAKLRYTSVSGPVLCRKNSSNLQQIEQKQGFELHNMTKSHPLVQGKILTQIYSLFTAALK